MFLTPFFLIAAGLGATIPLVLHLMHNQRKVQIPFPTLRFLKLAEKQSSRRVRLENFLLWLVRTLIMALLGLAFAMPMIRSSGLGWLGDAPRDVAIVIDASYSMNYNTGRGTVWQKSMEAASSLIEGLNDKDRFCIFLAHDQPEAIVAEPISNKKEGLSRLKTLQPGYGSSRLAPAVSVAFKALRKSEASREKEIHVISDNQALPWKSFTSEPGAADWNPAELGTKIGLFVSLLGVTNPENSGIGEIAIDPVVVRKGASVQITASSLRTGAPSDTTATLFLDGKEAGRRPFRPGDPAASSALFSIPPLGVGTHFARIETPDDNLPLDNSFHFLIRVRDQMPTLVVGTPDDTLFVRTALRTGLSPSDTLQTITPEQLNEQKLSNYASVFFCNALPLSGQALGAIQDYVKAGGLLVLFPGMKAAVEAYKPWVCLPGIPAAVEAVPFSQSKRTLTWDKPQHPLLRSLREGMAVPALGVRRSLPWTKIYEGAERLVSMGSDQPFLLERSFGSGRVLMFAVSADRTWSDFPLSPFYLPLVVQCSQYGAGVGAREPFIWATDSLSLSERFPDLKSAPTLNNPETRPVAVRSAAVEGRTVLLAEDLSLPGIYTMATIAEPELKPALAVNVPRAESDLTPIAGDQIAKTMGLERVHVATDLEGLRRMIGEYRMGRTYGEHLLWIAFALIAVEFIYANALMHRSSRRIRRVGVDSVGHVTTNA